MKGAEVLNTPGYYYAFAYWLSAFVIIRIYQDKPKKKRQFLMDAAVLLALQVFMHLTDGVVKWLFIPSMMVVIVLVLLYVRFNCNFTGRKPDIMEPR